MKHILLALCLCSCTPQAASALDKLARYEVSAENALAFVQSELGLLPGDTATKIGGLVNEARLVLNQIEAGQKTFEDWNALWQQITASWPAATSRVSSAATSRVSSAAPLPALPVPLSLR